MCGFRRKMVAASLVHTLVPTCVPRAFSAMDARHWQAVALKTSSRSCPAAPQADLLRRTSAAERRGVKSRLERLSELTLAQACSLHNIASGPGRRRLLVSSLGAFYWNRIQPVRQSVSSTMYHNTDARCQATLRGPAAWPTLRSHSRAKARHRVPGTRADGAAAKPGGGRALSGRPGLFKMGRASPGRPGAGQGESMIGGPGPRALPLPLSEGCRRLRGAREPGRRWGLGRCCRWGGVPGVLPAPAPRSH